MKCFVLASSSTPRFCATTFCSRSLAIRSTSSMSSDKATGQNGDIEPAAHRQQRLEQQHPSTQFTDIGLEELRQRLQVFAAERHWQQFHTPRNLLLALVGEVGELSEIFQWRGEVQPGLPSFSAADQAHVGQELSDVLLYLVRLADVAGVDLGAAVREKLAANAAKYPAEHCRGKADKYTAYTQQQQQQQQQQHRQKGQAPGPPTPQQQEQVLVQEQQSQLCTELRDRPLQQQEQGPSSPS